VIFCVFTCSFFSASYIKGTASFSRATASSLMMTPSSSSKNKNQWRGKRSGENDEEEDSLPNEIPTSPEKVIIN